MTEESTPPDMATTTRVSCGRPSRSRLFSMAAVRRPLEPAGKARSNPNKYRAGRAGAMRRCRLPPRRAGQRRRRRAPGSSCRPRAGPAGPALVRAPRWHSLKPLTNIRVSYLPGMARGLQPEMAESFRRGARCRASRQKPLFPSAASGLPRFAPSAGPRRAGRNASFDEMLDAALPDRSRADARGAGPSAAPQRRRGAIVQQSAGRTRARGDATGRLRRKTSRRARR